MKILVVTIITLLSGMFVDLNAQIAIAVANDENQSALALMFTAFGAYSLSVSESEESDVSINSTDTCYYFVETTLDRGEFWNNRPSLSFLISNVVSASCSSRGGTTTDILNQFNEAVKADGRYADAKLARIVFGPYRTRQVGHREHRRHIANYLSNNHVVTDFSFRYYRD